MSLADELLAAVLADPSRENCAVYADHLVELGVTQFEPATAAEYAGSEQMLKEFFGYQ